MDGIIISKLLLLAAVGILLLVAAFGDIRERRIPNRLILVLALLFLPYAFLNWLSGVSALEAFLIPVAVAAAFFLVTLALFAAGAMGGGDVKLIAATALFVGSGQAFLFAFVMAMTGGLLALVMVVRSWMRRSGVAVDPRAAQVPYGVAIACAGLWVEIGDVRALFS
ncbi:A24 family peptidase [Pseudokordiimonas caeni]|uniref:A24 family peptidase n=1 Tax=Pseudokordiimonas caeni TaxID=2997908 RepID=UPI0028119B63|nr:prepilin peptidase [Pseudokordiimonas caeni]